MSAAIATVSSLSNEKSQGLLVKLGYARFEGKSLIGISLFLHPVLRP